MSYRCEVCGTPSAPATPRLLWIVKRADGTIAREVPTCLDCRSRLAGGESLGALIIEHRGEARPLPAAPPILEPVPLPRANR